MKKYKHGTQFKYDLYGDILSIIDKESFFKNTHQHNIRMYDDEYLVHSKKTGEVMLINVGTLDNCKIINHE